MLTTPPKRSKSPRKRAPGDDGERHRVELALTTEEHTSFTESARIAGLPLATWARIKLRAAAGLTAALGALLVASGGLAGCGPVYQGGRMLSAPVSSPDGSVWYILDEPAGTFGERRMVPLRCAEREEGEPGWWQCTRVEAITGGGAAGE